MAYDVVFRKRVTKYKDAGHTFKEVNEAFGVDSKRYYSLNRPVLSKRDRPRNATEK
jgi:hypothetical protein